MVVRVHRAPRRDSLDPDARGDPMPTPAEHVDVRHATVTNLGTEGERAVSDAGGGAIAT